MPGPYRGAIGCCVRAGLSAGLASRGGEIGRNLRLEDRTGEATGRILEDGEIEVLRLVRLAASLVEARQGQPRVAAERTIDGGGLPVCVAGSRGVPRRPAGGGKAHERLLAKVVPRGRCGEELAISRGGRGGIGLPGGPVPLGAGGGRAGAGGRGRRGGRSRCRESRGRERRTPRRPRPSGWPGSGRGRTGSGRRRRAPRGPGTTSRPLPPPALHR